MFKLNKLKLSIFSLFVIGYLNLPIADNFNHNQSATSPPYYYEPTIEVVSAQDDQNFTPPLEELLSETDALHPQWNHNVLNIGEAWQDGYTGSGIRIAILDTGFFNHPDITMAGGDSVFADDPWSNDHSGHGTHIAGIIGAHAGTTYQGIAPGAELFGIKIYHEADVDEEGYVSTDTQSVASGIQLARNLDVDIIVISSGLTFHDENLYEQIQAAHGENVLIIAASGNGNDSVNYPAVYEEVISVTALDERLFPAMDIIYGQENDFAAPGVNIGGLSIPDSAYSYPYIYMSGSSQAAPHIAGVAAILMEKYNVRGEDARRLMNEQAMDIGDPNLYGHGLLRYVSNQEIVSEEIVEEEETEEESELTPAEPSASTEDETEEERAVRKPTSARAPDAEEVPVAFYQVGAIINETESILPENTIPMIESGGTIEIALNGSNSLFLTNQQVSEIRERNITLILAHENASWTIPPANLSLGQTTLRFYEGTPLGIRIQPGQIAPVYTTAIYQAGIRQNAYPGWMNIRYNITEEDRQWFDEVQGYYWDREEEDWMEATILLEEDSIILQTRHTSAVGLFNPALIAETNEQEPATNQANEEEAEDEPEMSHLAILGLSTVLILLIVISIVLWRRRQKKT